MIIRIFKRVHMYNTTSVPPREEAPDFFDQCKNALKPRLQKIQDAYNSHYAKAQEAYNPHYFKAFMALLKAIQSVKYIVELIFDALLPNQQLTGGGKLVKAGISKIISSLSKGLGKVKNVMACLDVRLLSKRVEDIQRKRYKAKKARDPDKMMHVDLKSVSLVGDLFGVPETISKFVKFVFTTFIPESVTSAAVPLISAAFTEIASKVAYLVASDVSQEKIVDVAKVFFTAVLPELFERALVVCGAISLLLSTAGLISEVYGRNVTIELLSNLQAVEHHVFIDTYIKKVGINHASAFDISTGEALASKVAEITKELKDNKQKVLLKELQTAANRAFVNQLMVEIELQPNIVKKQFKIRPATKEAKEAKEAEEVEGKSSKRSKGKSVEKGLIHKIGSERLQNDRIKLPMVVANLKQRLEDKIFLNNFSVAHGSIKFCANILSTIVAVEALFTSSVAIGILLAPALAATAGVLAIATVVNIFYKQHKEQLFLAIMEKLIEVNYDEAKESKEGSLQSMVDSAKLSLPHQG
jgi:hypothetical protein